MKSTVPVCVAMLFLCGTAHAAVWYVHPDSTLNSIQTALNSCATGDTVLVGSGTYVENLTWPNTQGIDLISEYGSDTTIIDGDSAGRVISCTLGIDTATVMHGFTIRNGYINGNGAGIYCSGASPTIMNNLITANVANGVSFGGALACAAYSSPMILNNTITGNMGTDGGGIQCLDHSSPIINGNTITYNVTDSVGGGIQCFNYSHPTITGNTITDNSANWVGGGVAILSYSSPLVSGNVINQNVALGGGGIYINYYSSPTIIDNVINGNVATVGGGISCVWHVSPTTIDNIITENTGIDGAGIYCSSYTSGVIKHCIISNNSGYGLEIRQSTPDIDSCAIEYNTDVGVYVMQSANPTVNWCNITDNQNYGIQNTTSAVTLDAENNWWGDASGPGGVGPGSGNPVSLYVDYDPWLTDSVQGIGIEELEVVKPMIMPMQVSPNPFRHTTNIRFMIHDTGPMTENAELKIYDLTGRLVRDFHLTPDALRTTLSWDGRDDRNRTLPSGVFFLKLEFGDYRDSEKLTLLR